MIKDIDLTHHLTFPPILNQGRTNTCVAHCVSAILTRYFSKYSKKLLIPSVLFLYGLANDREDCGCIAKELMK